MSEKKTVDKRPIRDLLQEKDAFLTTSEKALEYLLRHTKAFIVAVAVAAVCIVAVAVYTRYQKSAEAESVLAYEQALQLATTSQADANETGLAALEKVRLDYEGRQGSRLAAYALVNLYAAGNAVDKALPLSENLLQTLKPSEISLKPLLLNNLGGLYESSGDFQHAGKSYEAILTLPNLEPALRIESLMALGRVKTAAGQKDEAIGFYQTVIADFPQSFKSYLANAKMAELKGEAVPYPLPGIDLSALSLNSMAPDANGADPEPESAASGTAEADELSGAAAVNNELTETDLEAAEPSEIAPEAAGPSVNAPAGE